jgi:Na+-transporting methylmalonyl-CoA/oxaloacetate decarboxylase gamma subunit
MGTEPIVEIILIGFTLMIFGIPFLLGIGTFFVFLFGGVSAVVGTHGGKELEPEGAEIVFLAAHPKYRLAPAPKRERSLTVVRDTASKTAGQPEPVATLLPLRRLEDADSKRTNSLARRQEADTEVRR